MNKEKCLKAYDNLCKALVKTDYVECVKGYTYQTMEDELEMLYQLINEHFDNPPLKFEELNEGMWVWDNFQKKYFKIFRIRKWNPKPYIIMYSNDDCPDFEENRFYRYEVEEDE